MRLVKTAEAKKQYVVNWSIGDEQKGEVFDKRGQAFDLIRGLRAGGIEFTLFSTTIQPLNAVESESEEKET